jgi:hypothetical protein
MRVIRTPLLTVSEGHGDGEVRGLVVFPGTDTTAAEARRRLLQTRVRR